MSVLTVKTRALDALERRADKQIRQVAESRGLKLEAEKIQLYDSGAPLSEPRPADRFVYADWTVYRLSGDAEAVKLAADDLKWPLFKQKRIFNVD